MADPQTITVFWFRRDLRLNDNNALYHALQSDYPVQPLFIYDKNILDDLDNKDDARLIFIYNNLSELNKELKERESSLLVKYGEPLDVFRELLETYTIATVYFNEDYEPYAIQRDRDVENLLREHNVKFKSFKDHVLFHKDEVLNEQGEPYKVFSAYKRKWLEARGNGDIITYDSKKHLKNLFKSENKKWIELPDMGFQHKQMTFPDNKLDLEVIRGYDKSRDFPWLDGTTRLGIHFRHGTISIREAVKVGEENNATWLNELIWREFYSMILFHFPEVVSRSFKPRYDQIEWINDEEDFRRWKEGDTGYPIVDAGMRQLNESGYMHNRLRMITASFLTKHLLIDWRWGETYFARKLLDYELASNNGGWQWAAGTGTDAQPYFRVFNPYAQTKKFDPEEKYIRKWVPEYAGKNYPEPMIDHKFARSRAIDTYKKALS